MQPKLEILYLFKKNIIFSQVSDPHKVGDGMMKSYMAYKVTTKTTMSQFKSTEIEVDRRLDYNSLFDKSLFNDCLFINYLFNNFLLNNSLFSFNSISLRPSVKSKY